jgi:hypothetical protein
MTTRSPTTPRSPSQEASRSRPDLDDILAEADAGLISTEEARERLGTTPLGVQAAALADLKQSTPREEIKQRPTFRKVGGQRIKGPDLSYVDARYVMDVLDNVVGPENWSTDQQVLPDGSVVTKLTIRITDGETTHYVSKSDVGVPSTIEPMKGAFSDSFKRAAVHWGIARDLYEEREEESASPGATRRGPIRERYTDEDDDEPTAAPARRPAASRNGRTDNRSTDSRLREKTEMYDRFMEDWDVEQSPWYCPDHDVVKVMPPGIGKQSGKPYGGFLACTERGCNERGPWIEDTLRSTR